MARNQYIQLPENQNLQIKSLTSMRNSTLLCGRGFMGIALQARHLNYNL